MLKKLTVALAIGLCIGLGQITIAAELILRDDVEGTFERIFRTHTLALRDPHVLTQVPVFGCVDFTDTPVPTTTLSLNGQIADALDMDDDGDTFLDLSPIIAVDQFDPDGFGQMVTQLNGQCPAPAPPAVCTLTPPTPPAAAAAADNDPLMICLQALAGTTSGYLPAVPAAAPPCLVTDAQDTEAPFGDLMIPLTGARFAASWDLAGDRLSNGLIMGFLRESDADELLLPIDLPLIGGQPLSVILPGGNGNCASGDDRDVFNMESGWWFYFESISDVVTQQ